MQYVPYCHSLQIVPETTQTLVKAQQALEHCKITSSSVDALKCRLDPAKRNHSGLERDELTTTLFRHCALPSSLLPAGKISTVRNLSLKDLDLRYCRDTWFRYLELPNLKDLSIECCEHADLFLAEFKRSPHALEGLTIVHNIGIEDRTIVELDGLLESGQPSLKPALICIRNTTSVPSAKAINAHKNTLRHLMLDLKTPDVDGDGELRPYVYTREEIKSMLKGCESLAQLALYTPRPSIEYSQFDDEDRDFYAYLGRGSGYTT